MDENNNMNNSGPVEAAAVPHESQEVHRKLMGVLAYLGPLVIIPYLVAKEDSFVKFHIKQGVVLLIISILTWSASVLMAFLMPLWAIVNFGVLILALIGVVNVYHEKEKELPLVGHYSSKINI